jgi:DNA (cytosine-5)-methyltransferase 1
MTYYNEFDRHAAAWLRELGNASEIEPGDVDERSIADVTPDDVRRFTRCHFFAGIGGWDYALRLAGWPRERKVWTGSCPCQPYSAAGKRKGHKDERDLWPTFFNLIKEVRPPVIFGEQVASSDVVGSSVEAAFVDAVQRGDYARANKLAKRVVAQPTFHAHPRWLTRVRTDMEGIGYTVRWKVLGAHSVRAPHIRKRLYWVANSGQFAPRHDATGESVGEDSIPPERRGEAIGESGRCGGDSRLGDTNNAGLERWDERGQCADELSAGQAMSPWDDSILIPCRDGKARRLKPSLEPLVDGLPGRVALLRGAGNAIVPQVAAAFIRAFLETEKGTCRCGEERLDH